MKRNFTNQQLVQMIARLKQKASEEKAAIWKRVATDLEAPARRRRIVNISNINISTKENETIVVPGKVLATGDLDHKVVVAAFAFSTQAVQKIKNAKGEAISISDLMQKNPKGTKVKVIG